MGKMGQSTCGDQLECGGVVWQSRLCGGVMWDKWHSLAVVTSWRMVELCGEMGQPTYGAQQEGGGVVWGKWDSLPVVTSWMVVELYGGNGTA